MEGVPYVGPDLHLIDAADGVRRCPEGTTLPSTVRACLEYAGDTLGSQETTIDGERWRMDNLYVYMMGVTGCAFRLNWGPGWGLDNTAVFHMSDDPGAPGRRAMLALGFPEGGIGVWKGEHDQPGLRRQIVPLIQQAQAKDTEAIDHIERALQE